MIAEEKALLDAADPSQHHLILEQFFPQKMFILMQLPISEQKKYHQVGPKLSKKAQKELARQQKAIEKMQAKSEKERKSLMLPIVTATGMGARVPGPGRYPVGR